MRFVALLHCTTDFYAAASRRINSAGAHNVDSQENYLRTVNFSLRGNPRNQTGERKREREKETRGPRNPSSDTSRNSPQRYLSGPSMNLMIPLEIVGTGPRHGTRLTKYICKRSEEREGERKRRSSRRGTDIKDAYFWNGATRPESPNA